MRRAVRRSVMQSMMVPRLIEGIEQRAVRVAVVLVRIRAGEAYQGGGPEKKEKSHRSQTNTSRIRPMK